MNILIVFSGECFRDGGQHSRLRDTEFSYHSQKEASYSHNLFFQKLLSDHHNIDVHINSYTTKYAADLEKWYQETISSKNIQSTYHTNLHVRGLTMLSTEYLIKNIDILDKYDAILILRPDLYLKQYFLDIFDIEWQKIMYPNRLWLPHTHIGHFPQINDTLIFIPKKYYYIINSIGIKLYHYGLKDYIEFHGLSMDDIGFMINTLHDSDTGKDYNPLYRMVSRNEVKYWYSYGWEIDNTNYFNLITTDKYYKFPDWNLLDDNIPKHEKDAISDINNVWEWWHSEPRVMNKFHNLIEFMSDTVFGQQIRLSRHPDQSYWKQEDNKIIIYHNNRDITTIFEKQNDILYTGMYSFNKDIKLSIKKLIR